MNIVANIVVILAWILSAAFTLLIGTAAVLYIRRTWHTLRSEEDGSSHDRILDGLDHLETQVHLLGERMERLERRLPAPDAQGAEDETSEDTGSREGPSRTLGGGGSRNRPSPTLVDSGSRDGPSAKVGQTDVKGLGA